MARIITNAARILAAEEDIYEASYEVAMYPDDMNKAYLEEARRRHNTLISSERMGQLFKKAQDRVEEVQRLMDRGIYVYG